MKRWLQVPFALLALVAMLATALPQTLWACPMTGRVDSAARVCLGVMPLVSGEMPCAHTGGKCCKPVSVPSSQGDDQHQNSVAAIVSEKATPLFSLTTPTQSAQPFLVVAPYHIEPVAKRVTPLQFGDALPNFWISHRPITCAGRAPPVL